MPDSSATLERLERIFTQLRLPRVREQLRDTLASPPRKADSRLDWLLGLFEAESAGRIERRIERRFKDSRLPDRKTFDAFDFPFQPTLSKDRVMELATLDFIDRGYNVLLAGFSGTGKSHIAMALGWLACMADYTVRYTTCEKMLATLNASLADGSLQQALEIYTRPSLLILDEVGLEQTERAEAMRAGLMQKVLLPRHEARSTIVTSNIDWETWGPFFGDELGAAALIDRLIQRSHVFVIEGPSYRTYLHELDLARRAAAEGPTSESDAPARD